MRAVYSFSVKLYSLLIHVAALLGNKKAALWVNGRQNWEQNLSQINPTNKKVTWVHAASLGEFEQARPIIEEIKKNEPEEFILVSFFSPSGYEVRKNYDQADKVIYLPIDSTENAKKFLELARPRKIFFIKYEFWFNYLHQISLQKIDCYLVSGIFRKNQHFFKFYGSWFKKQLTAFSHFFVQNKESAELLGSVGYKNTSITGDTRLDRVLAISKESYSEPRLDSFSEDSDVIIFGSSWEKENEFALNFSKTSSTKNKIIIAPHEINLGKIGELKNEFHSCKLLSETDPNEDLSALKVLIIDKIGILSFLYRYGKIAVIGGGFGAGIHSTLEAVAYNCPVIFGPNYVKFQEAHDLLSIGAGFCVKNQEEFTQTLDNLAKELNYKEAVESCKHYISHHTGATKSILNHIYKK